MRKKSDNPSQKNGKVLKRKSKASQKILQVTIISLNLTILRLIERELANLELSLKERVQIGLAYIKFQRFFYSRRSNRSSIVLNDY